MNFQKKTLLRLSQATSLAQQTSRGGGRLSRASKIAERAVPVQRMGACSVRGFAETTYTEKDGERRAFQAETKKLLNIVAKSIYTDKEVFIRELLSNCSDALEKQKFMELTGESQQDQEGLRIEISSNERERTVTIFDSGVGMTKQEAIDNLGTIAKSGSKEFMESLDNQNKDDDALSSIIGQFGIGFYSSFIVADKVEVYTKSEKSPGGVAWVSDGSGEFTVSDAENLSFTRGTKIILKLRADSREFCSEKEIEKVIQKFSQFISYPIRLNGQQLNSLQAIWYREKREVTDDEYERFYEQISSTKVPFKYNLHYSTDVPLSIKALLYVPSTNTERANVSVEPSKIHLYSRKILIKSNCTELLPNYLRFVKGVVDCEDLPLNISRETYQDTAIITKLRNVLTRRMLKLLEDEAKKAPATYMKWYEKFQNFLKEGTQVDHENKEQIFKLLRFNVNYARTSKEFISLDDYVAKMKEGQRAIYYAYAANYDNALSSPYYESIKETGVPVLILSQQVDELCLTGSGNFNGKEFVNIEQAKIDEIRKDLGMAQIEQDDSYGKVPDEEVTSFCLWLKSMLSQQIQKVQISNRLNNAPAVVVGQMSSSMYMMMQMMEMEQSMQGKSIELPRDLTLEINPFHSTIVNLNLLRKEDASLAESVCKVFFESLMQQSTMPYDQKHIQPYSDSFSEEYLEEALSSLGQGVKVKGVDAKEHIVDAEIIAPEAEESQEEQESILKQAQRDVRSKSGQNQSQMHVEYKVTGKEGKQN